LIGAGFSGILADEFDRRSLIETSTIDLL